MVGKVALFRVPLGVINLHTANHSRLLSEAIDEGLGILGERPMQAIYNELEVGFHIPKSEIPMRFSEFSTILNNTLGPTGSSIVDFIVDRFYERLGEKSTLNIDIVENTVEPAQTEEKINIRPLRRS